MDMMARKFVYSKGAGIVFCPDDVLYVSENYERKWQGEVGKTVEYSALFFVNEKFIEFNHDNFEEIKSLLINSTNIKKEYDTSKK